MRLFLSSYKIGNAPHELVSLVGKNKRTAIVMNALDNFQQTRDEFYEDQRSELKKLGFQVAEIDLRKYFNDFNELRDELEKFDLVWINGGNSFILRRAMKKSGFDEAIKKLLQRDSIVYGGFSAGSVVVAPTLRGLELVDAADDITNDYLPEIIWEGLNLIDFSLAVHYNSDSSESAAVNAQIEYYEQNEISYRKLSDGQALVINGNDSKIVG